MGTDSAGTLISDLDDLIINIAEDLGADYDINTTRDGVYRGAPLPKNEALRLKVRTHALPVLESKRDLGCVVELEGLGLRMFISA